MASTRLSAIHKAQTPSPAGLPLTQGESVYLVNFFSFLCTLFSVLFSLHSAVAILCFCF